MSTTAEIANAATRILIAEDSPTQAERLKYILELHNYQVISTPNGRAALEAARLQKPTLIISDILMPGMNGYELCRQIKSDPELTNVPVILVTTLSDPQDVIRSLECGADNFIIKPYDEHYLLSRIQFVLMNRPAPNRDQGAGGVEIHFNGERHLITADRLQILNLLLSTYEAAIQRNQELSRAKDALRDANASLESANKEMEAFSYSVSHDLRAPLRAIEGFTRTVLNDHATAMNDDGRGLLQRVQKAGLRMAQLIEDLLGLSQVSRKGMRRETVDLSAVARTIVADLQNSSPARNVNVNIAEGLTADCDAGLLRAALENLLGNAWKFTSKRADATIEFGMTTQGADKVFFVRDNGAGFDMAYAKRLFGAFQRLHSTDDFPGTGIGLATVQRIIHRHGGHIEAKSAVDAGTTFYFTL